MPPLDPGVNEEGKARPNHEEVLADLFQSSTLLFSDAGDLVLPDSTYLAVADFFYLLLIGSSEPSEPSESSDSVLLRFEELLLLRLHEVFELVTFVVVEVLAEPAASPLDGAFVKVASFSESTFAVDAPEFEELSLVLAS
jgi:hypothetical protein